MANTKLFPSARSAAAIASETNHAGGAAYAYEARQKLAQLAMTGTLQDLFYVDAVPQLADIGEVARGVDELFLAQTAVLARREGHMKDTPAFLLALLSARSPRLFAQAFGHVVDNGRMLRTFAQIMRSGAAGRTSLGTRPKRMVAHWLESASDREILRASIGTSPSLADVIRMVHPKPQDVKRSALLAFLIGKPCEAALLPEPLQAYLGMKASGEGDLPDMPFQMLTSLPLDQRQWTTIAERCGWQALRMNLNAFARHGVFADESVVKAVAARLGDAGEVARSRVLPYQLLVAESHLQPEVPDKIRAGLHAAMEIAVANVPTVEGRIVVCPDVSGSMGSPVTGYRRGAASVVRMVDVAALMAAAIVRKNRLARVVPFDTTAHKVQLDPTAKVSANARILAGFGGGGTDCSQPLALLNREKAKVDLVVVVSDNQSWIGRGDHGRTPMMKEWRKLKRANPGAKMVLIDIAPYGTSQMGQRRDVLLVGGFSDAVFAMIADFVAGKAGGRALVERIEAVAL